MTEPTRIGVAAEHAELSALAKATGRYRIFFGTFGEGADPELRRLTDGWFVAQVAADGSVEAIVFSSPSAADVRAFLGKPQPGADR